MRWPSLLWCATVEHDEQAAIFGREILGRNQAEAVNCFSLCAGISRIMHGSGGTSSCFE